MNPEITNKNSNIANKKTGKLIKIIQWIGVNWLGLGSLILSGIAIGFAISANNISKEANIIAKNANEISNKLEKLDLRPIIKLKTLFRAAGKLSPHFSLTNSGPIEAQQVKIKMLSHRYFPKEKKILISGSNSIHDISIVKIAPLEKKSSKFSEHWLSVNSRIHSPPQHNIMEIQLKYRRPQDLKEYNESAYYFINPDGLWVGENESSLNSELYKSIKSAIFNMDKEKNYIYKEFESDRLHSN